MLSSRDNYKCTLVTLAPLLILHILQQSKASCPAIFTSGYGSALFPVSAFVDEVLIPRCASLTVCGVHHLVARKNYHHGFWYDFSAQECHLGTVDHSAPTLSSGTMIQFYSRINVGDPPPLFAALGDPDRPGWRLAFYNGTLCEDHGLEDLMEEELASVVISKTFKLYSCGTGVEFNSTVNCLRLDLTRNNRTWEQLPSLPHVLGSFEQPQISTYGEKLFFLAGSVDYENATGDIYMLDTTDNNGDIQWTKVAKFPFPITSHTCVVLGSDVFTIGGIDHLSDNLLQSVYHYDMSNPEANPTNIGQIPEAVSKPTCKAFQSWDSRFFITCCGGTLSNGYSDSCVELELTNYGFDKNWTVDGPISFDFDPSYQLDRDSSGGVSLLYYPDDRELYILYHEASTGGNIGGQVRWYNHEDQVWEEDVNMDIYRSNRNNLMIPVEFFPKCRC